MLRSRDPGRTFSTIDCVILACTMTYPETNCGDSYTVPGTHWGLKWTEIRGYMGVPGRAQENNNIFIFQYLACTALIHLGNLNP